MKARRSLAIVTIFLTFTGSQIHALPISEPNELAETVVIAPPLPAPFFGSDPTRETILSGDLLRTNPASTLDNALRQQPGFRLFRRTDSIGAHPTTQGVSLGNVGPNGASRTTVLQDGIPINDPFGGWVPWTRYRASDLAQITLVPDGGLSPWGTPSLGGTIALESRGLHDNPFLSTSIASGNRMPYDASVAFAAQPTSGTRWFGSLGKTDFSGYPVLRIGQRGLVDTNASVTTSRFDLGLRNTLHPNGPWQTTLRVQGWDEQRGNGTTLTTNRSRALDLSARLDRVSSRDDWSMENILFHQERRFASTFTAVTPDRSAESLTLDQHSVPSRSTGFIQRIRISLGESHHLGAGWDTRFISGATHEHFFFEDGIPLRERSAGGRQRQTGLFLLDTWKAAQTWTLEAGARLDQMNQFRGELLETVRASGAVLKQERPPERSDIHPTTRLSARWQPTDRFAWRCDFHTGVRFPTLNELYRPFRVGSVTTAANAALRAEEVRGVSSGISFTLPDQTQLHARFFFDRVTHAIANVTTGPNTLQRRNLDATEVRGIEFRATRQMTTHVTFESAYAFTEATVTQSRQAPRLVGRSLPQVPSHAASLAVRARFERVEWTTQGRWNSASWDDDLNQMRLNPFLCIDSRLDYHLGPRTTLYTSLENLTATEIMTRRESSGLIGIATPRMWSAGIRHDF
jgi:outer membrane receptor protein involved in Fe transport